MRSFNFSALAVRERAITLFFIFASALAGIYACRSPEDEAVEKGNGKKFREFAGKGMRFK